MAKKQKLESSETINEPAANMEETPVETVVDTTENISDDSSDAEVEAPKILSPEEIIDNYKSAVEKLADQNLRLRAEADNIRRNAQKDKQNYIRYKNETMGKDMLVVVDDFDRCLQNLPNEDTCDEMTKSIITGVKLINNRLMSALSKNSITKMDIIEGAEFDVNIMEAVSVLNAGEEMVNKVIAVTEPGYMILDKVLRYAKVVVGQ